MRRTPLLGVAAALCLTAAAASCSSDGGGGGDGDATKAELTDQLSETLQGGAIGFDKEAADCYAAIVVDEVGVDALKDVDLSAEEPPQELQDEIAAAAIRGAEECELPDADG